MTQFLRFASIDVGLHNLCMEIEDFDPIKLREIKNIPKTKRYTKNKEPTPEFQKILNQVYLTGKTIYSQNKNVWEGKKMYVDEEVLLAVTNYLESLPILQTCDVVIVEKQLNKNNIAKPIENHIRSEILRLFKHDKAKQIIIYSSSNKTQILGAPKFITNDKGKYMKMDKPHRKKWACKVAAEVLKLRKDQATYDHVFRISGKKDDLSDCILQLQSAKYRIFVDKSLKECIFHNINNFTKSISDVKKKIKDNQFNLITTIDNKLRLPSKIKVKCSKEHSCLVHLSDILNTDPKKWCEYCYHEERDIELDDLLKFVDKEFKGICLSPEYLTEDQKLQFQCSFGHCFWRSVKDVKDKIWCTECSYQVLNKEILRYHFETIFSNKFPQWELLDGYSKEDNIGFTYCMNDDDFTIQDMEEIKKLCKDKKVKHHIVVPYSLPLSEMKSLILSIVGKDKSVSYKKHEMYQFVDKNLEEIREIAFKNGGECLSKISLPSKKKGQFRCKHGDIFESTVDTIKRKIEKKQCWCKCGEKITDICEYVLENGKNKGSRCKNRVSPESTTQCYCKMHCKHEKIKTLSSNSEVEIEFEDDDEEVIFLD